jgi:hypothetical protein
VEADSLNQQVLRIEQTSEMEARAQRQSIERHLAYLEKRISETKSLNQVQESQVKLLKDQVKQSQQNQKRSKQAVFKRLLETRIEHTAKESRYKRLKEEKVRALSSDIGAAS